MSRGHRTYHLSPWVKELLGGGIGFGRPKNKNRIRMQKASRRRNRLNR